MWDSQGEEEGRQDYWKAKTEVTKEKAYSEFWTPRTEKTD